jgi:MOSC domain-containing protein YiiM
VNGVVTHIHITPAAGMPMQSVEGVYARPGVGLEGDRYARGLGHFSNDLRVSRDVTLVSEEAIEALRDEHNIVLEAGDTRRNVSTHGVDLNQLVGKRFFVGDVLCVGTRLCNPCRYLADLLQKPVVRPLVGRGGLRADLLTEGRMRVGDTVAPAAQANLVIGTTNPEKARQTELALTGLDLNVRRLEEVAPGMAACDERSTDPGQNALEKARAYRAAVNEPVLAIDFGLFLDGINAELQPGAMVRRPRGSQFPLDDEQLVRYYSEFVARHGGQLTGRWQVALALATAESIVKTEVNVKRTFVARPSSRRVPGYPLASLQLASTGRYISELGDQVMAYPELALPLRRFVAAGLSRR